MPHLALSRKLCGAQLKRIWLPRTMWLEGRGLDAAGCQLLLTSLECTGAMAARALVSLDLRNSKISNHTSLVTVVRSCRSLRSLNVSRTRLRDIGAYHLLNGLVYDPISGEPSPHPALRILALEDNKITAAVGPDLARVVEDTPLQELLLASNELGDEGAEALAAALASQTGDWRCVAAAAAGGLVRLDVSRNRIDALGFVALIEALRKNLAEKSGSWWQRVHRFCPSGFP